MVGRLVEEGQYPRDMEFLGKMIENISYYNAKKYFGF
jgi:glucuronate isomerase